jgi:hypothetical protein
LEFFWNFGFGAWNLALGFYRLEPLLSFLHAPSGALVSPLFVWCLRQEWRDGCRLLLRVQRDESQMRGRGDKLLAGVRIFASHLDADLHRGAANVIDAGPQDDLIADMDRVPKDEGVDLGRDDLTAAVPLACHRRDHVDPTDDGAAESGPLWIRLLRHHQIPRLDGTLTRRFALFAGHEDHNVAPVPGKSTADREKIPAAGAIVRHFVVRTMY